MSKTKNDRKPVVVALNKDPHSPSSPSIVAMPNGIKGEGVSYYMNRVRQAGVDIGNPTASPIWGTCPITEEQLEAMKKCKTLRVIVKDTLEEAREAFHKMKREFHIDEAKVHTRHGKELHKPGHPHVEGTDGWQAAVEVSAGGDDDAPARPLR